MSSGPAQEASQSYDSGARYSLGSTWDNWQLDEKISVSLIGALVVRMNHLLRGRKQVSIFPLKVYAIAVELWMMSNSLRRRRF